MPDFVCALLAMFLATPLGVCEPTKTAVWHRVVPGEFEPVAELVVGWDPYLADYEMDVIDRAAAYSPVRVLVDPEEDWEDLRHHLKSQSFAFPVVVDTTPIRSVWVRDYGPVVVRGREKQRTFVDFRYFGENADDRVPRTLARRYRAKVRRLDLEFEGGNFLSDGRGRCIVTTLAFEANPNFKRREVEAMFRRHLGCRQLIAVPYLEREETHHVDMFAAMAGPNDVLVGRYAKGEDEENSAVLDEVADILKARGFRVRRLPMPRNSDGLFRTYANLTLTNGAVLVPVYDTDERYEREALAIIGTAFPGRQVIPVVADDVIQLQGSVRCTTGVIPL